MLKMCRVALLLLVVSLVRDAQSQFTIDYENDCFAKEGKPFQVVSGSIHYYNVPYQLWEDRLRTMRNCGMNTLQTYLEWRTLEAEDGVFDFSGQNNITDFIITAQRVGLLVIIRLGPYIDSEREMGGLPWWLLNIDSRMQLRSSNPVFLDRVKMFWTRVAGEIKHLLYRSGGPIIMLQLENEYGSYFTCDFVYTQKLREIAVSLFGQDVIYYTTDGNSDGALKCGKNEGLYPTVDFGTSSSVKDSFDVQRRHALRGPLMNSEFYPGWLDIWGVPHQTVPTSNVIRSLDEMLSMNASVNMYMFHGGTHFGLNNGAELSNNVFTVCPTSYDYDAPINEAGDPTEKCLAIKKLVSKYIDVSKIDPKVKPKMSLGDVVLRRFGGLKTLLGGLKTFNLNDSTDDPQTFEELRAPYGLVVYETTIDSQPTRPSLLKVAEIRDRGYVYVDYVYQGILSREIGVNQVALLAKKGSILTIIVENQGRVCFGSGINDYKGLIGPVTLGSQKLGGWKHIPLPYTAEAFSYAAPFLNDYRQYCRDESDLRDMGGIGLFEGTFTIDQKVTPQLLDTYLRFDGWSKGYVLVNGVNIGRYWPAMGPQVTLYVPGVYLKYGVNEIIIMEQEEAPQNNTVSFVDTPVIDGPVATK